ncbi:hypothetical protein Tco_0916852, partial [Tanacetum coccineum]
RCVLESNTPGHTIPLRHEFWGCYIEGLDMYVYEKQKDSAWVARYGHAGEGWNRLHRHKNSLDRLDELFHVIPALMVVESEVLNDFPSFVGVLIAVFAAGGAVNLALNMKGDMIIKDFYLKQRSIP